MNKLPLAATGIAAALLLGALAVSGGPSAGLAVAPAGAGGAGGLTLAPGISFTDDSSPNFPIRGDGLDDGRLASDRPTAIFFGTAHCWNTAREAERFVALYRAHAAEARFLVVDLDRPSADQKELVARFYRGYIPHVTILDARGGVVYDRAGETGTDRGDASVLEGLLRKAKGGS